MIIGRYKLMKVFFNKLSAELNENNLDLFKSTAKFQKKNHIHMSS